MMIENCFTTMECEAVIMGTNDFTVMRFVAKKTIAIQKRSLVS